VKPWEKIAEATAPDGELLSLRRRDREFLILAGGRDLMSSEDDGSSRALSELGCQHLEPGRAARVLVGGLGMGFTLRAALDAVGPNTVVEIAEFVPAVVEWNEGVLGELAGDPLKDPRTELHVGDVRARITHAAAAYDAILLDVDNGPTAHAHDANNALYSQRGIASAWKALRPAGVLGVWSFSDDARFTARLKQQGFHTTVNRVPGSRKGRGRQHVIWIAQKPATKSRRPS
jgi:spermidine synthase